MMTEVKLYKVPSKGLKLVVLAIPFVAIGIWMVSRESSGTMNYIMGWVSICFFGLGIPIGLFQAFDRRPQIIISENGIWDRSTHQDEIKWNQIKAAYALRINGQRFVSLVVDGTFIIKKKQYKWAAKLTQMIGAQKINLLLSQLQVEENKMSAFVNEMIKADGSTRKTIIGKYFIINH